MKINQKLFTSLFLCFGLMFLNAQINDNQRPPLGARYADGLDPFLAPADTTNYYGSGDVNMDGIIDSTDMTILSNMAGELIPGNPQADVDGSGSVDATDMFVMYNYLNNGTPLPGMWNRLTTRAQRENWVLKMLAIDKTNTLSYVNGFFQCGNFARQLAGNFRGCRTEPVAELDVIYNRASAKYNIPMYPVTLTGNNHGIDAVLVGDNPEQLSDWLFIEPQAYENPETHPEVLHPELGQIAPGYVTILTADELYEYELVKFNLLDTTGNWTLISSDRDLVRSRPIPPVSSPDNRKDFWEPRILNSGSGKILFETMREDMARNGDMDIHQSELPFSAGAARSVITESGVMAHLIDLYQDQAGVNHVLYFDRPKYQVGNDMVNVFGLQYGIYNENEGKITAGEPVWPNLNIVMNTKAKLCVTSEGTVHVFWVTGPNLYTKAGLFWAYKTASGWTTPVLLVKAIDQVGHLPGNWIVRNFNRLRFDAVYTAGKVHLAWIYKETRYDHLGRSYICHNVSHLYYSDEVWSTPTLVTNHSTELSSSEYVTGLDLEADAAGHLHLVYQKGEIPLSITASQPFIEGRASLHYMYYNGSSWNSVTDIDTTQTNLMPQLGLEPLTGDLYLVWEKKVAEQVVVVWKKYANGQWSATTTLPIRAGAEAWYPTVKALTSGEVVAAFSSLCPDWATIETYTIAEPPVGPSGVITVYYEAHQTAPDTNTIQPWFKVKNNSSSSLNLANVTLRYWFTREGTASQSSACDYASSGHVNITPYVNRNIVPVVPGLTGADHYLEIGFGSGAGSLAPGQETGPIQIRLWKSDWTNYSQTGDYSFNASMTSFGENIKVTGYVDDNWAYGDIPQ